MPMAMYSISLLRRISARGMKPATASRHSGCEENFVREAGGNRSDQRYNEGFDQAEAPALERENDQNIHRGNENAGKKRQAEEQFQSDGGAKDFGEIARSDGNFADDPKEETGAARIVFAASLREVAP